jgi:hypothetical protein
MLDRKRVKNVKLKTNPVTIPKGLLLPLVSKEDERIIGKTGSIQGDNIVTTPATNANITKIIILLFYF